MITPRFFVAAASSCAFMKAAGMRAGFPQLLSVVSLIWSIQLQPHAAAFQGSPPRLWFQGVPGGITSARLRWDASARPQRQRLRGRLRQLPLRMIFAAGGDGVVGDPPIKLPVIDLGPMMRDGGCTRAEREAIGAQVRDACMTNGIFYVSGHGVDEGRLASVLQASRSFFSLSQQKKESITCPPGRGAGFTRGYIELGGESGSDRLEVRAAHPP